MSGIFILVALMFLGGVEANAEELKETKENDPKFTIQFDPLTAALGYAHLQFEYAFADSFSFYAGPHLRFYDSVFSSETLDYKGVGLEAGLRWFWWGKAPEGAWLQVRGVGAYLFTPDNATFGGYGSILAGYTAIFGGWFVLSGGAGGQYIHYHIDGLGPKGFYPALHTAVGVAF